MGLTGRQCLVTEGAQGNQLYLSCCVQFRVLMVHRISMLWPENARPKLTPYSTAAAAAFLRLASSVSDIPRNIAIFTNDTSENAW